MEDKYYEVKEIFTVAHNKKDNEILIEVLTWEDGLVGLRFCPYEFLKWFQDKPSIKQTKDMINNYVKRI